MSVVLQKDVKRKLIELLTYYKDYFTQDNYELPELDKDLVKHCILIKPNFKPYK